MIIDLEKRKDKAMKRSDTDDIWIKIESLQWVLFVIFAIKNERMVVILFGLRRGRPASSPSRKCHCLCF